MRALTDEEKRLTTASMLLMTSCVYEAEADSCVLPARRAHTPYTDFYLI